MIARIRLALAVLRHRVIPDDHPETQIAIHRILAEVRETERGNAAARQQLEDAVRLKWITANRDNIARRPEVQHDNPAD